MDTAKDGTVRGALIYADCLPRCVARRELVARSAVIYSLSLAMHGDAPMKTGGNAPDRASGSD